MLDMFIVSQKIAFLIENNDIIQFTSTIINPKIHVNAFVERRVKCEEK